MSQSFFNINAEPLTESLILEFGELLRQRGWSVSCAESCTGGGVAYAFTSVSGSSDWFNVSWVTYSNEAKQRALAVEPEALSRYGAVSQQVVEQMVLGVHNHSGAELGVAVSGVAGPGGGSKEKPVGTVWFGFYLNGEVISSRQRFEGDRKAVRQQSVAYAVRFLFQWLVENPVSSTHYE